MPGGPGVHQPTKKKGENKAGDIKPRSKHLETWGPFSTQVPTIKQRHKHQQEFGAMFLLTEVSRATRSFSGRTNEVLRTREPSRRSALEASHHGRCRGETHWHVGPRNMHVAPVETDHDVEKSTMSGVILLAFGTPAGVGPRLGLQLVSTGIEKHGHYCRKPRPRKPSGCRHQLHPLQRTVTSRPTRGFL